jgi:hypothetical protein
VIDEQVGLERGLQRLEQAVGHRRTGEAELAHGADVRRLEALVMKEIVIERRHQIEIADLLGGDQVERGADVKARQADERAADQRHRDQRAHAHGVVERHDAECAFAGPIEILRHVRQRCGAFGAMTARHAFGPRGGARCIKHH